MTIVGAATPILLAALGELVVEKAGVLNLGVEGMMLVGAVTGFAVTSLTGARCSALVAAMLAATAASLIFGFLTLTLASNQVATGLALTIFGIGLSSMVGETFVGTTDRAARRRLPRRARRSTRCSGWSSATRLLVYFSLAMTVAVAWFLKRARGGLILRAVGENDLSAHSIGYSVIGVRYAAVAFGGAMAGLAGCYFSLVQTPMWAEELTAGRGWIALALVVFAAWKPLRLLLGAYLFGAVMTFELHAKAAGVGIVAAGVPGGAALSRHHRGAGADLDAALGRQPRRRPASAKPSEPTA